MPRDSFFAGDISGERTMLKPLAALGLAAVVGFALCQSAQAQYVEHRISKHRIVKCYRDFVIGGYGCHTYTHW
jgi:hypothetical protein